MLCKKKAVSATANSLNHRDKGSENYTNKQEIEGCIASLRKLNETLQEVALALRERRQFL